MMLALASTLPVRVITSSLMADYRQERRHKYGSGDMIKDTHRWIMRADAGFHPGHGGLMGRRKQDEPEAHPARIQMEFLNSRIS